MMRSFRHRPRFFVSISLCLVKALQEYAIFQPIMATVSQAKDPELFIGLVGAVGADLNLLCSALQEALAHVRYSFSEIHVIEKIHHFARWKALPEEPLEIRYKSHI